MEAEISDRTNGWDVSGKWVGFNGGKGERADDVDS